MKRKPKNSYGYTTAKAELVVMYGRERFEKTYLVDRVFNNKITLRHTRISPIGQNRLDKQLEYFYLSLQIHGMKKSKRPKNWLEAFF